MPRFLRIGNTMIHIPSLSSVTIGTTCVGKPYIALSFHVTKNITYVYYKNWDTCQDDFNRVKKSLGEVEASLEKISLTEPEPQPQKFNVESVKQPELLDQVVRESEKVVPVQ